MTEGWEPLEEKATTREQELSVQTRATDTTDEASMSFFLLANTGSLVPPWWSERRDIFLGKEWLRCPLFSGAVFNTSAKLATIPPVIEPRDPTMKSHRRTAEQATVRLMEGSEFNRGWLEFAARWYQERWTQDNGAFAEILGEGRKDGPIQGPALGISNLDAQRCQRTGHPEFPVVYTQEKTGKRYKLHRSRVVFSSQMPSTRDEMHGVGYCWLSRVFDFVQTIVDDLVFKQEKLGRRPKRAILVGKKISVDLVKAAFEMADQSADNQGLTRMATMPIVANPNASDVGIDLVDLASLPDGFDFETDVNLTMYAIALTGGFPVRWMWPATASGATKADALLQHMATAMSGAAYELETIALLLGGSERGMYHQSGKFLPPTLKMRFEVQDDWMDQVQAEIQNTRAMRYERNIADGAVSIRVTREQMLSEGEISEAQFRDMELESGRTQDGLPVDTLFYGDNPYLQAIDPEDFTEEDVKAALRKAKEASVKETSQGRRAEAREAVAALQWLLEPEEEAVPGRNMAAPEEDAPVRGAPREMTSTRPIEPMTSDKSQEEYESEIGGEVGGVLDELENEFLDDIEAGEEPDYNKFSAALLVILIPLLMRAFMDGWRDTEEEYNISFDPAEVGAMAAAWARQYGAQLVTGLTETTRKVVANIIAQHLEGALTREQLIQMLEPAFGTVRAEMIAITETTRARNQAILDYADMLRGIGLEVMLIWETAQDDRTCSACRPLHGSTTWTEPPPLHVRCRCRLRLEIRWP